MSLVLVKTKTVYEDRFFNINWTKRLPPGVLIDRPDVITVERTDGASNDLSVDEQSLGPDGKVTQIRARAGTFQKLYKIRLKVILTDTQKKEAIRYIRITE